MPTPEFESQPIYIQGGNPNAFKNYLERSTRSAQTAIIVAEFHLKTTNRLNILKRRKLKKQTEKARQEINKLAPVLGRLQLEEVADEESAKLG